MSKYEDNSLKYWMLNICEKDYEHARIIGTDNGLTKTTKLYLEAQLGVTVSEFIIRQIQALIRNRNYFLQDYPQYDFRKRYAPKKKKD